MEYLDKHHISYDPPVTEIILHRKHQRIHGKVPIINDLNLKMRQYDKLVQLSIMLKNWMHAYKREFDTNPVKIDLTVIKKAKQKLLRDAKLMIEADLEKIKHIKGFHACYLAQMLAYAHPNRFPSLRKFLYYCGHKQVAKTNKRYNRKVCSLARQIAVSMIIEKDEKYYPLYLKIKQDIAEKNVSMRKVQIHEMALNRVGTFLLKEIYAIFH